MILLDERILEQIDEHGWSTPKMMARHRTFPEYTGVISDRCKRLHYAGLVEPFHGEMYDLTVEGRMYLKGDLDARHQPIPTAAAVHKRWSFPPTWHTRPIRFG